MDDDLDKLRIDKSVYQVHRTKKTRKAPIIVLIALFTIVGILYGTGIIKPAVHVRISTVTTIYPSQMFTLLNASGYVVAQRKSAVSSKITSWLASLSVEEGSKVKKGDIIARLENEDAAAALKRAEADLKVAHSKLKQTEAELKDSTLIYIRAKELLDKAVVSQSEYDSVEAKHELAIAIVEGAKAAILASKAALEQTQVNFNYTFLRAPFDAVVLTKNADVGDIVTPLGAAANAKASVVTIADLDSLQVEVDVSESNIEQVSVGMPCEIQLDAMPNDRFRGKVHMIVFTADRTKATILVKVAFEEKDARILPEMSAKVAFLERQTKLSEREPIKAVSTLALHTINDKTLVYVVANNRIVEKVITTGRFYDNMVEVISGIDSDEKIIAQYDKSIQVGKRVKIVKE